MIMDEDIMNAAMHEAGHAVMYYMSTGSAAGIRLIIENGTFREGEAQYLEGIDSLHVRLLCALAGPVAHNLFECPNDLKDYSRFPEDAKVINAVLTALNEDERTGALDLSYKLIFDHFIKGPVADAITDIATRLVADAFSRQSVSIEGNTLIEIVTRHNVPRLV